MPGFAAGKAADFLPSAMTLGDILEFNEDVFTIEVGLVVP